MNSSAPPVRRKAVKLSAASVWISVALGSVAPAAEPAIRWDFGQEEPTKLTSHGGVHRDVPGPRPPEFPEFDANNTAVKLDGEGSHFSFGDTGPDSPFDFTNGDAITLEAWVNVEELRSGDNRYVIGKGRTGDGRFPRDNQNWALRVREIKGKACVSFLFATPRPETGKAAGGTKVDAHWHRWTTNDGFAAKTGWHHIAAAYRFGKPETVRGWIDGKPLGGSWDMGGETVEAPVVDDDAVWIGSSNGGQASNSFRGYLDAVAIHREILSDDIMKKRFVRTGGPVQVKLAKEVMPTLADLPAGQVLATFHDVAPAHTRWLNEDETWPAETDRFVLDRFLLPRLPQRYDAWGIRDAWRGPVLVRLAADVQLTPGKRKFLLRARALSRLWVDGVAVARTKPITKSPPSGEEPITPVAEPPRPGLRRAEHQQQEVWGEAEISGDGRCRIVLETIAGGRDMRPETGELSLCVETADGRTLELVGPVGSAPLPFTAVAGAAEAAKTEAALAAYDDRARHAAAATRDDYWKSRHDLARAWGQEHPAPATPRVEGLPADTHFVDAFLAAKTRAAVAAAAQSPPEEAKRFHSVVLPLLREHCFRCHGDKDSGGLRLNSREALFKGGDSGEPVVVPNDPAKSPVLVRIRSTDEGDRMPPTGPGLTAAQAEILETWIREGARWPAAPVAPEQVTPAPFVSDAAFLRRVTLDVIGLPPTPEEVRAFLADRRPEKYAAAVDRLLADERWADHWMGYWLDVLAENPGLINPTLNSTGPFRWFLYDSFRDNRPFDRFVTELLMLRGGAAEGGSAGFGLAGENDSPFATKGYIAANAFLGIEMQCARCHDSPYHSTKQRDLFALAALFERKNVTVPKSSTVPAAFFEKKARASLIEVTLKPGEPIKPAWPFAEVTGCPDDDALRKLLEKQDDSRERLAALFTSPRNERFAQVIVNRVWRRFLGAGFVEPVHDWEGHAPSHPELLARLSHEFVTHDYDLKHLARLILTSQVYRRAAVGRNLSAPPELRFFVGPDPRRLSAEQVVDSLVAAGGGKLDVEELTFNPHGRRGPGRLPSLGVPTRAWMFAGLANERDRPSLSLPRAAAVAVVLEAFGWNGARQAPRTDRETAPSVLQPGSLSNGTFAMNATRAARDGRLARLALDAKSPEELVDTIFLRYLGRLPTAGERTPFVAVLADGFAERVVPVDESTLPPLPAPLPVVTFFNHLVPEANNIAQEQERRVRTGPPVEPRLRSDWRETYEDFVWSVVNTPEFVWMP